MSDDNLAKAPGKLLHIPRGRGGRAQLQSAGRPSLRLDGPTIAGIFLGKITKWNDPPSPARTGVSFRFRHRGGPPFGWKRHHYISSIT